MSVSAAEIQAERQQAKVSAICDAIGELERGLTYHVDCELDELVRLGVFASLWGSGVKRNVLCARIAKLMVTEILSDGACDLPDEVRFLFSDYIRGPQP